MNKCKEKLMSTYSYISNEIKSLQKEKENLLYGWDKIKPENRIRYNEIQEMLLAYEQKGHKII